MILTKIKPELNIVPAATSMDEYSKTSLLINMTPIAKPKAERTASMSPKLNMVDMVVGNAPATESARGIFAPLATAIKNPPKAMMVPVM